MDTTRIGCCPPVGLVAGRDPAYLWIAGGLCPRKLHKPCLKLAEGSAILLTNIDFLNGAVSAMKRIVCGLFTVIGLLCVMFPRQIIAVLPYVLGIAMAGAGALYCAPYFRSREARVEHSTELASGCVLLVVGIVCIVHGAEFIGPMGIVWAMIGIRKAARSLSRAIQEFGANAACVVSFMGCIVRMTLSVLLLLYPMEKFVGHIVLLGLELIAVSIRPAKRIALMLDGDE